MGASCVWSYTGRKDEGRGSRVTVMVTRFVPGYLFCNISPTCQATKGGNSEKRCPTALPVYVGLSRCSAHAAEHCMRTKDGLWMRCWPHATFGVSTSPRHYRVAARVWRELGSIGSCGQDKSGQAQGPRKQAEPSKPIPCD
jgi:hypothetical protein